MTYAVSPHLNVIHVHMTYTVNPQLHVTLGYLAHPVSPRQNLSSYKHISKAGTGGRRDEEAGKGTACINYLWMDPDSSPICSSVL